MKTRQEILDRISAMELDYGTERGNWLDSELEYVLALEWVLGISDG